MSGAQALQDAAETARDRVRRLFIAPLAEDGMRFRSGTPEDVQRKRLDRMADDLAYMSDDALRLLKICMRTKGEGSNGVFWPTRVSILKFANAAQPRPIEDIPGFRSWFASAAGAEAAAVPGRLVAEYAFFCRHLHPPYDDAHKAAVASQAAQLSERAMRLEERAGRGVALSPDDSSWLSRYRARDAMMRRWIDRKGDAA